MDLMSIALLADRTEWSDLARVRHNKLDRDSKLDLK